MHLMPELPFESIEEAVVRAKSYVASFLATDDDIKERVSISMLRRNWISELPEPEYSKIAAVDGSNNSDYLTLGQVLFITSASLFFKDEEAVRARKYQIGVLEDYYLKERISFCRETMEVKMGLKSLDLGSEILLMDGSFIASINRGLSTPYGQRVPYHMRRILEEVMNQLKYDLTDGLSSITHQAEVSDLIGSIVGSILEEELRRSPKKDEIMRAKAFIEGYEKLLSLNKLLKGGRTIIIAIAKRSSSSSYFDDRTPDLEIIRRYSNQRGFLLPKVTQLTFPEFSGIGDSYPITLTYVRLEKNANPLRVEIVGSLNYEEVAMLLSSLARYSVRGYPYHLRVVHEMTKISKEMMLHLARNLKIVEISGREILGE